MALPLASQTASIAGTVQDSSGAVIPGAIVRAVEADTGLSREVTTNASGYYHFPLLPVGTYTISTEAAGFRKYERAGFSINLGQQAELNPQLEVGNITETVMVTAESPLLNTRSSEVTAMIEQTRMREVPLNGRNPIELAGLLPGVSGVNAPQFNLTSNSGVSISVAGSRGNHNSMLFDGSNHSFSFRNIAQMYPSPDSLREFRITRNLFSAEFGTSGGGVLNAITRSGSNEFHGSFYEFLRNDNLNARDSFLPRKTHLIQNQFGFTGGGPVVRNKLFYFGALEFLRVRPEASTVSAFPPTAAERAGDFSASATIRDPLSGTPFPNQQIPLDRYDTVSRNILDRFLPLPNQPDGRLITSASSPVNAYHYIIKLDYQLSSKHTFYNRFFGANTTQDQPISPSNIPGYAPGRGGLKTVYNNLFSWAFIPSATTVNEFRASLLMTEDTVENLNRQNTFQDLGGNFPNIEGHPLIPSRFDVSGRFNLRPQTETDKDEEQFEIYNNFSWQLANHSLKFGGRWHHGFYKPRIYDQSKAGTFTFDRSITGNALADFILGRPVSMSIVSPNFSRDSPGDQYGFYIQDDWRVTPELTLNLGLRYELQIPWIEERGIWSTLYKNSGFQSTRFPNAPVDMAFHGDPGVPDGMIRTDKNNFQPRFGFAYRPGSLKHTVFRGGAGMFGEINNVDIIQNTGQPFQFNNTFFDIRQLSDPLRGLGFLPLNRELDNPTFTPPFTLDYPNPNYRSGYIFHYNFLIQHEFARNWSLEAGYVGKSSRKLSRSLPANPALFIPGQSSRTNIEQRRIFRPGLYGSLTESSSSANSNYNSLQLEVIHRMSSGFLIQAAYTYAKSLDNVSGLTLGGITPNPFDWSSSWGPSDFDITHNANLSYVWELPRAGRSSFHKILLHDWELTGILAARTGTPFSVFSGQDIALSGTGSQTADVVGDPVRDHANKADAVQEWFETSAFTVPETGRFGTGARNNVRGPGFWNLNFGVFRNIPAGERFRLQFRSEFFNVFNPTNLGNPNNTLNNIACGRILGGSSPRVIQFAFKLYY
jgi:hypothetical protein